MQIFDFESVTNMTSPFALTVTLYTENGKKKKKNRWPSQIHEFYLNRTVDGEHNLKLKAKLFSFAFHSTKCLPNRYHAHKFDANIPRFVVLSRTKFLTLEIN